MASSTNSFTPSWGIHALSAIVAILVILPVLLNQYPPLNDYPWHLARIVILSNLDNPVYREFYQAGSLLLPNMAMSMVALPLSSIVGAEYASRIFVALSLLAMLWGCIYLHRVVHKRVSPWPLLSATLLFNGMFYYGFLNYIFGMGVALVFSAAYLQIRSTFTKHILTLGMCLLLMLLHFSAFGIFATIVGTTQIYQALVPDANTTIKTRLSRLFISALPFLIAIGLFVFLSPTSQVEAASIKYSPLGIKAYSLLYSVLTGTTGLDIVYWLSVILLFIWLFVGKKITVSVPLLLSFFILAIAFIILPSTIMEVHFVDHRLGPALALVGLAVFDNKATTQNSDKLVASVALLLALICASITNYHWAGASQKTADIISVFNKLEAGATVFSATAQPYTRLIKDTAEKRAVWQPPLKHIASYAILSGPKFVPMTFVHPSMQPLNVRDKYRDIKAFQTDNPRKTFTADELHGFLNDIRSNMQSGDWPKLAHAYVFVMHTDMLEGELDLSSLQPWLELSQQADTYILLKLHTNARNNH